MLVKVTVMPPTYTFAVSLIGYSNFSLEQLKRKMKNQILYVLSGVQFFLLEDSFLPLQLHQSIGGQLRYLVFNIDCHFDRT